jgi:hypothetical protein
MVCLRCSRKSGLWLCFDFEISAQAQAVQLSVTKADRSAKACSASDRGRGVLMPLALRASQSGAANAALKLNDDEEPLARACNLRRLWVRRLLFTRRSGHPLASQSKETPANFWVLSHTSKPHALASVADTLFVWGHASSPRRAAKAEA